MVWELALAAWELRGGGIPDYPREETPVVIRSLRSSGARPDFRGAS